MVASNTDPEAEAAPRRGMRSGDLRELLERTLQDLNEDGTRGPLLRATGMRLRLRIPDAGLVVDVASSDAPDQHLRWSFDERAEWEPQFELEMSSDVANAYLQGGESVAIAIARRRVRCRCDSRAALVFLPAVKLIAERYKRIVAADYPHLALEA
jgi:hypothetical protein